VAPGGVVGPGAPPQAGENGLGVGSRHLCGLEV
jgi:hypothetical protein